MADHLEVHVSRIQRTAAGVTIAARLYRLGPAVVDADGRETRARLLLRSVEETLTADRVEGLSDADLARRLETRLVERATALRLQHRWSGREAAEVVCRLR